MLSIILLTFLSCPSIAQKLPYNCLVLEGIIKRIELQQEYIKAMNRIANKYEIDKAGKVVLLDKYRRDTTLVNIVNRPDIDDIISSVDDSVLYLADNNILLDTLNFFSSECSCRINNRNIMVLNKGNISDFQQFNVWFLTGVDTYHGYSTVSIRHRSAKISTKRAVFMYSNVNNKPQIEKLMLTFWGG